MTAALSSEPNFSICVYCGSRPGENQAFADVAAQVGLWIGRHGGQLVYGGGRAGLMGVVADATLEQMVFNVLDNARDASPHWVRLQAQCDADALRIVVTDRGPGFSAAVLRHIGTPYQSTKGRPGGGLGLFLSMNVARTLGGSVVARNRPEGGAEVTITLSLAAITLQDTDSEDHGH